MLFYGSFRVGKQGNRYVEENEDYFRIEFLILSSVGVPDTGSVFLGGPLAISLPFPTSGGPLQILFSPPQE